jgi:putative endonuclease
MFAVYILFSSTLNKYYVGQTSMEVEERLLRHMHDHSGFTSKAKDWIIVHTEKYTNKTEALKKETTIKRRGIKRYLESLKSD